MPTIRASTAPTATTSPTSPASTQVGDLVIVVHWTPGTAGEPTHTLQSGNGFVQIRTHAHNDGSTDGRLSVAYKIATASGANTYNAYTSSGGTADFAGIVVLQVGTWEQANASLIGDVQGSSTLTTNAVPNPPSVVTPQTQCLVLAIGAWHMSAATATITAPSGYLETWEIAGSAAGELSCASKTVATATTEDPGAFTDDVTPNGSVSMTLVFRPRNVAITATSDTFTETGNAAGLTAQRLMGAASGSLSVTGFAATLGRGLFIAAAAGSIALAGQAADLIYTPASGETITADAGSFTVSGRSAGLTVQRAIGAATGSLAVSGNAAGLTAQRTVAAASGSLSVTGQSATFARGFGFSAAAGTLTETGNAAGLTVARRLESAAGSLGVTGNVAVLARGLFVTAAPGTFGLTGSAATFALGIGLEAGAGSFAVTGRSATFPIARVLGAASGTFTESGQPAGLLVGHRFTASSGALSVTGNSATLVRGVGMPAAAGTFAITGRDATLTTTSRPGIVAARGTFTLSGSTASFSRGSRVLPIILGNGAALSESPLDTPIALTLQSTVGYQSFAWTLLEKPTGSAAALTSASGFTSGFTPDVAGTYRVRGVATDSLGNMYTRAAVLAVRTRRFGLRKVASPASATEEILNEAIDAVDDGIESGELDAVAYGVPVNGDPIVTRSALTAAIAAAVAAGKRLVLPPGTFNVHGLGASMTAHHSVHAVQVISGTHIVGRGGVIKLTGVNPADAENVQGLSNWPTNCALFIQPGASNIRIEGVTFQGTNDPFVDVLNNQTAAIYGGGQNINGTVNAIDGVEIDGCRFENMHGFSVHTLAVKNVTVRDCVLNECANGINTNGENTSVLRCDFWKGEGIEIAGAGKYGPNITGATNASPIVITTASAHGLEDSDYVYVKDVAGNTAANGTWPINVLTSTTFELLGSTGSGAYTSGGSFAYPYAGRTRIIGNTFRKMGLGGAIALGGTDVLGHSAVLANNIIDGSETTGIIVSDGIDNVVITGNVLRRIVNPAIQYEKVGAAGFNGPPNSALIQGNYIAECDSHGVYIANDCADVSIQGNRIEGGIVGIYGLSASSLFVDGNNVSSGNNGFHFTGCSDVNVTENNSFAGSGNAGFVVDNNATVSQHVVPDGFAQTTLTFANFARRVIVVSGTPAVGTHVVIAPAADGQSKIVRNNTSQSVTFRSVSGTGPTIPAGESRVVFCFGGNWIAAT